MKRFALLAAFAVSTPAFAQDQDPVYQMIDGIGFCMLGQGKADTTIKEMEMYDWSAAADAAAGVTTLAPASGPTSGVVSNDVGYCQIESSAIGTGDAEMAFDLFMMGGNSGIEVTEDATNADGCMQKTLSNGAVATLTSGGDVPTCEGETTSAWHFEFASA